MNAALRAFLCHATEDYLLAREIAGALQFAGIETFFAGWSIGTGDSIRDRIDTGLKECTHFVVLLTEASIAKPWVITEIDAGFILKVEGQAKFMPLRYNLPVARLSPLLRAMQSPELKDLPQDILSLVGEIYGVSKKPALGERPKFTRAVVSCPTGLSVAAGRIAAEFVRRSERGRERDPKISVEELLAETGLSNADFEVAVSELEAMRLIRPVYSIGSPPFGYRAIESTSDTFIELDPVFMDWNPREDAVRLAIELLNSTHQWLAVADATEALGWAPRRMNPALKYLIRQGLVTPSQATDPTFDAIQIRKNSKTLGFVRSHS